MPSKTSFPSAIDTNDPQSLRNKAFNMTINAVQTDNTASQLIGANNPPEPIPFVECREEIDGLMIEARNFLDGAEIASQAEADAVARLLTMLSAATKRADERRRAEAKPHDDAKAEIQARWNRLIGDTKAGGKGTAVLAIEVCRKALLPFELAQKREREAVAARLRAEAEEARRNAALATQLASRTNLDERENAEAMAREAAQLDRQARKAEGAKSLTAGGGRAMSVAAKAVAVVTDPIEFSEWLFRNHPARFAELMGVAASEFTAAGLRGLPGVRVDQQHTVRT
jgi:hypothetical protein